ncbi:hypothetical protein BUQ74_09355 [Leptospira weilii serovar Heyan]|nr:hypothetical protein BUQ74_09355 [Leptospira weilii serovar Heyan]
MIHIGPFGDLSNSLKISSYNLGKICSSSQKPFLQRSLDFYVIFPVACPILFEGKFRNHNFIYI